MNGTPSRTRRRARGEHSVYWSDERQRYVAVATVGYNAQGKRIVRKATATSESAALKALRKRVRDFEAGLTKGSEHYRVGQAVEDWLDHGQGANSEATIARARSLCETHVIPQLGGRKLRELRADEVDAWLKDRAEHLASSTLRRVHQYLSNSVRRAMYRGLAERNVVELCTTPKGKKPGRASKSLTKKQSSDVLAFTRQHRMHCYIVVSLLTGARPEEMRALRWENVHLEGEPAADPPLPPYLEVWRSVRAGGDTKTRRSRRTLALPALAVARLKEHRARQAQARLKAASWADEGLVFATGVGTAMSKDNALRDFRKALAEVPGLEASEWTPYELRHSFVSLLSSEGLGIEDISHLMGHDGTAVTEIVYRKELRPVIRTGAVLMDTLFELPEDAGQDDA